MPERLEDRMLLSASVVEIEWEGETWLAHRNEYVVEFDRYLAGQVEDVRQMGWLKAIEERGFKVEVLEHEAGEYQAIVEAEISDLASFTKWVERTDFLNSVTPHLTELKNVRERGVVELEWEGETWLAHANEYVVEFDSILTHRFEDVTKTEWFQAIEDFGVDVIRMEHDRDKPTVTVEAPASDFESMRRWVGATEYLKEVKPNLIRLKHLGVGDEPSGDDVKEYRGKPIVDIDWNGERMRAIKDEWGVRLSHEFADAHRATGFEHTEVFKSLAEFGVEDYSFSLRGARFDWGRRLNFVTSFENKAELLSWGASHPEIELIEPNMFVVFTPDSTQNTPNDTDFAKQWHLKNTGQTYFQSHIGSLSGTSDADMDGPEAWDIETGSSSVYVAILDTGVKLDHEDLDGNLDTTHDYDFVNNDSVADDDSGHGTKMAGIIGAEGNNAQGVTGINWDVTMIPVKVLDAAASLPGGSVQTAIDGIEHVINLVKVDGLNVRVINMSFHTTTFNQDFKDAVKEAGDAGILVVAAAGNNIVDIDVNPVYPASFDLDNVVSVGVTDDDDKFSTTASNFGDQSVDLAAPAGNLVLSTDFSSTDDYDYIQLTSPGTAQVSGVAALLVAHLTDPTVSEMKNLLLRTTNPLESVDTKTVSDGRLNAFQAVGATIVDNASENDLVVASNGTIHLVYFDMTGKDLRYKKRDTNGDWSTPVVIDATTAEVGRNPSMALDSSGNPGVSYYDATSGKLKFAKFNGTSWSTETIAASGTYGLYSSLEFDSSNDPAIAYYKSSGAGHVFFTQKPITTWQFKLVDSDTGSDLGRYVSMAENPNAGKKWSIAYDDGTNGALKYAESGANPVNNNWAVSNVHTGLSEDATFISLAFDDGNDPAISYVDSFNADLYYASRPSSVWQHHAIVTSGNVGKYSNLLFDGNGDANLVHFDDSSDRTYWLKATAPDSWHDWSREWLINDGGWETTVALYENGSDLDIIYSWSDGLDLMVVHRAKPHYS